MTDVGLDYAEEIVIEKYEKEKKKETNENKLKQTTVKTIYSNK